VRIVSLDLSSDLGCDYPATGPDLMAHLLCIVTGEKLSANPTATSQVFCVLEVPARSRRRTPLSASEPVTSSRCRATPNVHVRR
jgi:hypothetical protein